MLNNNNSLNSKLFLITFCFSLVFQMEHDDLQTPANTDDFDSACSTPFVSAPSSPGRTPSGFFYSAPASPIHFMLSSSSSSYSTSTPTENSNTSFEFEFTAKEAAVGTPPTGSMTSADELFLNGQIRPMNLLSPLHELDNEDEERGRYRSKSLRRRARSMSPMRTSDDHFQWLQQQEDEIAEHKPKTKIDQVVANKTNTNNNNNNETTTSGVSSRSSSVGRSSNRWVFLKEFLYRSKSEGRNSTSSNNNKFWTSLSFSPNNEKKLAKTKNKEEGTTAVKKKAVNGVEMRRVGRSAHEWHYTMNRAQAEEMRKKTYLPYKQGLLGCLGFSSKSYGAMNGFARALNPVSSR